MGHADSKGSSGGLQATGERINTLLEASAAGGVVARERAEELVRLVADLYGAGLERVLTILYDAGHLDDDILAALAADELVSSLLLVHDLHPYDVQTRVERALDGVRPYLGSHGGDVELLEVTEDAVVRIRLLGSCDGCASSAVTLKLAVEGAIEAAAPEVTGIEVETPTRNTPLTAGPVISVEALWSRLGQAEIATRSSWEPMPALAGLADGEVAQLVAGTVAIVGCRVGSDLFAYVDRCGQCGSPLAGVTLGRVLGGAIGDAALRCASCSAHFQVRRAGVCLERPELHLDPLPLLVDDGVASVAVPVTVAA
jgi:Fe-S cluster biogenesis protein NfuA/nitrite reductase/ring-hydroxylating ferredoxin subunit